VTLHPLLAEITRQLDEVRQHQGDYLALVARGCMTGRPELGTCGRAVRVSPVKPPTSPAPASNAPQKPPEPPA
jgi:hypothetical protein